MKLKIQIFREYWQKLKKFQIGKGKILIVQCGRFDQGGSSETGKKYNLYGIEIVIFLKIWITILYKKWENKFL